MFNPRLLRWYFVPKGAETESREGGGGKNLCKETESKAKLHLLVWLWVINEGLLQIRGGGLLKYDLGRDVPLRLEK